MRAVTAFLIEPQRGKGGGKPATWTYGDFDPDVLFLSFTAGTADDAEDPEIATGPLRADARWFLSSASPFVRRCGLFLYALDQAEGRGRLHTAAVCNLAYEKVAPGASQSHAMQRALEVGLPRLREFLDARGEERPILVVNADPRWLQEATLHGENVLMLDKKGRGDVDDDEVPEREVLRYELTSRITDVRDLKNCALSQVRRAEYPREFGRFPGGTYLTLGVVFSWFEHGSEPWEWQYFFEHSIDAARAPIAKTLGW